MQKQVKTGLVPKKGLKKIEDTSAYKRVFMDYANFQINQNMEQYIAHAPFFPGPFHVYLFFKLCNTQCQHIYDYLHMCNLENKVSLVYRGRGMVVYSECFWLK